MKEKGLADKLVICVPSGNFGNVRRSVRLFRRSCRIRLVRSRRKARP